MQNYIFYMVVYFLTNIYLISSIIYKLLYYVKAMEKASKNQAVVEAIGEPIARGPWYNASLAVTHKRHSVSCTFPVSGPHGTGIFQLRAVRNGGTESLRYFQLAVYFTLSMSISSYCPNIFVSAKFINNSYGCTTATKSSSNKRKSFKRNVLLVYGKCKMWHNVRVKWVG
ncbi:putative cytochrome c oxidase assembly factor 1 [Helianthus debilis subsp. tardiflorus]